LRRQAAIEMIRILLIHAGSSDTSLVETLLENARRGAVERSPRFDLTRARSMADALRLLEASRKFDVMLFDFDTDETAGPAGLVRLLSAAADAPVVILGDDDSLAPAAIRQGAQDWIPRSDLDEAALVRAIRHAVARKQIDVELRQRLRIFQKTRSGTQRKAVELRARAKELDVMNRELDDVIYVASHDLKEPLRGIRAYCELFADDYKHCIDREGVNRLRAIMTMCGRLETQISDLLTFYRVGRVRRSVVHVDLTEVVDGQVAAFRAVLDRRGATVRVKGPLPTVHGHPVLLGMVFTNLISNSLKYNRSKRPLVEIGTVAHQPCTIYVRDNGIGIPPEHHETVFELFRRLHGRKEFEGTGAGLTIVRKIIRSYQGQIWIESQPGQGTTFFFTLPAATPEPTKPPHWMHSPAKSKHP